MRKTLTRQGPLKMTAEFAHRLATATTASWGHRGSLVGQFWKLLGSLVLFWGFSSSTSAPSVQQQQPRKPDAATKKGTQQSDGP